ncbi:uncharacterized protein VP01_1019g1 [Puccinia sorghi]|uniref:Uncharacterized protein n=1 Tax=Puccinia sorghi TaxID=27349 RepID=A0A0L6VW74_9BASI|nr:uncharacterized protein VP01_1019g1 [Puccinia sorghi]
MVKRVCQHVEKGKTKKSLCSEMIKVMKKTTGFIIEMQNASITQKISNLHSLYNTACDWKRNAGAGILDADTVNGVKTTDDVFRSNTFSVLLLGVMILQPPLGLARGFPNWGIISSLHTFVHPPSPQDHIPAANCSQPITTVV